MLDAKQYRAAQAVLQRAAVDLGGEYEETQLCDSETHAHYLYGGVTWHAVSLADTPGLAMLAAKLLIACDGYMRIIRHSDDTCSIAVHVAGPVDAWDEVTA